MSVVLVAGTNSWDGDDSIDWYHPQHPLFRFLVDSGVKVLTDGPLPFIWSTDLDGVIGERNNYTDWASAGAALHYFVKMNNADEVDVIAHSHGLQVVLFAIAHHGLKVRNLFSFGSPVRKDLEAITKIAKQNIQHWTHIYSDKSDKWQWLGELFDGHLGVVREHPQADENVFIPKVGHSELLRNPKNYHYWAEKNWLTRLKG